MVLRANTHRLDCVLVRWSFRRWSRAPLPPAQKPYRFAALENIEEQPQRLSPRAFEPGILRDDLACFVAREAQQRPMRGKISEAKTRQAGLFRAEHLAFAAQAQVFFGDAKPVLRLAHGRDPRLGALAKRHFVKE